MIVENFINTSLPILQETDKARSALNLMKTHRLEHICATINGHIGILSHEHISLASKELLLKDMSSYHRRLSISSDSHIWEALRTFNQYDTCILPVINDEKTFVGSISIWDISQHIYDIFPIDNGGAILQMEMPYQNYSLSELARIIEGTNSKITTLNVFPVKNSSFIKLVFCIDKNDATECIQALERHGYAVDSWFMNKGKIDSLMEERYSAFMKYINI